MRECLHTGDRFENAFDGEAKLRRLGNRFVDLPRLCIRPKIEQFQFKRQNIPAVELAPNQDGRLFVGNHFLERVNLRVQTDGSAGQVGHRWAVDGVECAIAAELRPQGEADLFSRRVGGIAR